MKCLYLLFFDFCSLNSSLPFISYVRNSCIFVVARINAKYIGDFKIVFEANKRNWLNCSECGTFWPSLLCYSRRFQWVVYPVLSRELLIKAMTVITVKMPRLVKGALRSAICLYGGGDNVGCLIVWQ